MVKQHNISLKKGLNPQKIGGLSDEANRKIEITFMRPYTNSHMPANNLQIPEKIAFSAHTPITEWCRLLKCDKEDLLYAIRSVGNSYEAVNSFLILNRRKLNN